MGKKERKHFHVFHAYNLNWHSEKKKKKLGDVHAIDVDLYEKSMR